MTLVNRVSAFFLLAMAVMLLGYSALMYFVIRHHIYDQFDHDLLASLHSLVAAVEVEDDDVKWQPSDHTISLGDEIHSDEARWIIIDQDQSPVDHSRNLNLDSAPGQFLLHLAAAEPEPSLVEINEAGERTEWRYARRRLAAPYPKPVSERDRDESAAVTVLVARDSSDLQTNLQRLLLLAGLIPLGLWLLAAIFGRRFCRRALEPLRTMSSQARSMTEPQFEIRLPVNSTRDELSDLALAFNELLDRLQAAFDRQHRFTGDAAHQLRSPLTVFLGQIDVALRRPRQPDEYRQTLTILRDQAIELRQMVESLLFLARAAASSIPPDTQPIELTAWLPAYLERWLDHPRASDLSFFPANPVVVQASESLLSQLLDNLISNALKYSPPATPVAVRVVRAGHAAADQVQIEVQDRGPGIAPEDQAALFDPFFRSAQARRSGAPGVGLGLAIASRLAEVLGGRLDCDSKLGQGSTFRLSLPAEPADDTRSRIVPTPMATSAASIPGKPWTNPS